MMTAGNGVANTNALYGSTLATSGRSTVTNIAAVAMLATAIVGTESESASLVSRRKTEESR